MHPSPTQSDIASEAQLAGAIMRRVKTIYTVKTVWMPLAWKGMGCIVFIGSICFFVSIPHVISNLSLLHNLTQYPIYLGQAFVHTHLLVQIFIVGSAGLSIFMVRDVLNTVSIKSLYTGMRGWSFFGQQAVQ